MYIFSVVDPSEEERYGPQWTLIPARVVKARNEHVLSPSILIPARVVRERSVDILSPPIDSSECCQATQCTHLKSSTDSSEGCQGTQCTHLKSFH